MKKGTRVYIEHYFARKDLDIVEYTIDFHSISDAETFFTVIDRQIQYTPFKFYKLILPHDGKNRMFAGSWYYLPHYLFEGSSYESLDENSAGSAVYSGVIKVKSAPIIFSQFLRHIYGRTFSSTQNFTAQYTSHFDQLIVVDCGQGNWNEAYTDSEALIYDLGASTMFSQNQIQALVRRRFATYGNRKIDIIISHWDMDHFQALKYLTPAHLSMINAVYGPDNIPSTNVYKDAINNLSNHGVNYYFIAPTAARKGKVINLNLLLSTGYIDYFRAVKGGSKNQTGIVLAIKGKQKVALLTGDHHYPKILDVISGLYTQRNIILVTPHHGGNAGELVIADWQAEFASVTCPISVGSNPYKHPTQNFNNLMRLQNSTPDKTDTKGDINYVL